MRCSQHKKQLITRMYHKQEYQLQKAETTGRVSKIEREI
jgi:hypothetical protein